MRPYRAMDSERPIITLTTDFGMADGTVGAMIGVIKSICPAAEVINVASDVPAHDIVRGAWALYQAAPFFPARAIHVAVVDPGIGTDRRGLLVTTRHGAFVGPDNGVLSWVLRQTDGIVFRVLENPAFRLAALGFTFDGRDLFAPAAAYLASGVDPAEFGPVIDDPVVLPWPEPRRIDGAIEGEVLVVDQFGNLITNIPFDLAATEFGDAALQVAVAGWPAGGIVRGYAGIEGSVGVVINGAGLLEIAANGRSATAVTGLARGARVTVTAGGSVR